MTKWEIKVYYYKLGHMYTMHSNASLINAKANMMRRSKTHKGSDKKIAMIAIRDLSKRNKVTYRDFFKSGAPVRGWVDLTYCERTFSTPTSWDNANDKHYRKM